MEECIGFIEENQETWKKVCTELGEKGENNENEGRSSHEEEKSQEKILEWKTSGRRVTDTNNHLVCTGPDSSDDRREKEEISSPEEGSSQNEEIQIDKEGEGKNEIVTPVTISSKGKYSERKGERKRKGGEKKKEEEASRKSEGSVKPWKTCEKNENSMITKPLHISVMKIPKSTKVKNCPKSTKLSSSSITPKKTGKIKKNGGESQKKSKPNGKKFGSKKVNRIIDYFEALKGEPKMEQNLQFTRKAKTTDGKDVENFDMGLSTLQQHGGGDEPLIVIGQTQRTSENCTQSERSLEDQG